MKELYTIFEREMNVMGTFRTELVFYKGDLTNFDASDDKFCSIVRKNKEVRKPLVCLGKAEVVFPIEYPIISTDGSLIEDNELRYKPTLEDEEDV